MLNPRGGTVPDAEKDEIFCALFLQKFPITVCTALVIHKDVSLTQLTNMADNMAEVQGPQPPLQFPPKGHPEISAIQTELQKICKTLQSQPRSAQEQCSPSQPPIHTFLVPQDKKSLHQFVGLINYHHRFVTRCTKILQLLHQALAADSFTLTASCQQAFEPAKQALSQALIQMVFWIMYPMGDLNSDID